MYLTAITQRDRLFETATRWLSGLPHPQDGRFITEVFLLDHGITMPVVTDFLIDISQVLNSGPVKVVRIACKDEVRKRIITSWSRPSCRARSLFDAYQSRPEEFFPNTPVDLFFVTRQDGTLVAMTRLKRITRIADKLSRKVASRTAEEIRRVAMRRQAEAPGPTVCGKENERLAALEFKNGRLAFTEDDLRINDVIGTKFVGEPERLHEIERCILQHPQVLSVDRKEHHGAYNDVNLVVELACPPPNFTIDSLRRRNWSVAAERGLDPKIMLQDIPEYVESGADSFFVEIILCKWDDLIESEFGNGLHEEHVLLQRTSPLHLGRIATNASIAMTQLLLAAISPTLVVDDLPVKIWGRYLPDTLALSMSRLFGIGIGRSPFWVPEIVAAATGSSEKTAKLAAVTWPVHAGPPCGGPSASHH